MRNLQFQTGSYYHIYNRGTDKRDIFMDENDFIRFIRSMGEFNVKKQIGSLHLLTKLRKSEKPLSGFRSHLEAYNNNLVDIVCYSLLPNHFHFLLKQKLDDGIPRFLHKLSMGYAHYFNFKYNRSGSLFQGTYKATQVKTDEYILYLSAYINGNSEIHKIAKAKNYKWCSYPDYLGKRKGVLCQKNAILKDFKNIGEYKNLVGTIIKESQQRKSDIKKYLLE